MGAFFRLLSVRPPGRNDMNDNHFVINYLHYVGRAIIFVHFPPWANVIVTPIYWLAVIVCDQAYLLDGGAW